jgi:uncharacterized membrane protein
MDQNLQNNVNPNNIPQGSNVAQKHAPLVNQSTQTTAPEQYINPNNFQKVLGVQPNSAPQTPNINPNQSQIPPQNPNPPIDAQDLRGAVPQMPVNQFYKPVQNQPQPRVQNTNQPKSNNDIIKLVIYAVPIIAIFIHLLKSIDDEDVLWHSRQSLVGQGIWFAVLIILRFIDAPIISNYGPMLVNIAAYGLLVFAGIKAYDHQRYNIPVVYDIGKNFIDNKN